MRGITRACCLSLAAGVGVHAALADELELSTGEVLSGELIDVTPSRVIFEHSLLGELSVPLEEVKRVRTDDQDDVMLTPPPDGSEEADFLATEEEGFFGQWEGSLSVGFSGSEGDTRTNNFNTQFRAAHEDEQHRWLIDAGYFYGRNNGEASENEFRSELTKDWLLPESRWLVFAKGSYEFDHFQSWRHRFGGYGGLGYEFIKEEDLELIGRIGAGGIYELRGGRKFTPEALLGASLLRWDITENQTLTGSLTLYPNLEDAGAYRLNAAAEWVVQVSEVDGLSVKLGVDNRYESDPLPDSRRNNFKYYGAVVFDF